ARALAVLEPVHADRPRLARARDFVRHTVRSRAEAYMLLRQFPAADADWDRAYALATPDARVALQVKRADVFARIGETARAAAEAAALTAAPTTPADTLYDAACVHGVVATGTDAVLADRSAARAVALLRRAVAAGYDDVPHLLVDDDLAPLR